MARRYASSSSSSSSLPNLAADLHHSLTLDDDYGMYRDTNKGFDDGQRRRLSQVELFERTPKEEILAYCAKVEESEGFDVSDFPNAAVYGNISPIPNLSGDELELVTWLARSALASYNQKQENQDNSYKFVKVVMANATFVNGIWYYITFLVVKQRTCCDSAAASPPQTTFQARVFYGFNGRELDVDFCRPKPTHPSLSGFASQTPQHHNEARLSKKDRLLYYRMLTESEGFDVPDIPNSSKVPHIFRPIKSLDTDDANKLVKLCELSTEHYNIKKQVNCTFVKFLKGNKRDGPFSEYYRIELLVMRNNGKYQTLQARVLWDKGENPCVELCREKPGAADETRLSDEDSRIYHTMFTASEGFDVPDIPNSSEIPGLYGPMKSFSTDCVEKMNKLSNLSVDHYNQKNRKNCKFVKFLKANKRETPDGEDYNITLVVKHEDARYQTLQARVFCNTEERPMAEFCREKPGALMMEYVPEE